MEKAVVERVVDGQYAVLLVGEDEREMIVLVENLPPGTKEGTWLQVELTDDEDICSIHINMEETENRSNRLADKMALLRNKKESRYKQK